MSFDYFDWTSLEKDEARFEKLKTDREIQVSINKLLTNNKKQADRRTDLITSFMYAKG